eukprot:2414534-Rhodomonas_salina.1
MSDGVQVDDSDSSCHDHDAQAESSNPTTEFLEAINFHGHTVAQTGRGDHRMTRRRAASLS